MHTELKAIRLQLLLRSLGVIVSDEAVREAETLGVINMLHQRSYSNHACLGVAGFYLCRTAGADSAQNADVKTGEEGLIKVTLPDRLFWCWSVKGRMRCVSFQSPRAGLNLYFHMVKY